MVQVVNAIYGLQALLKAKQSFFQLNGLKNADLEYKNVIIIGIQDG